MSIKMFSGTYTKKFKIKPHRPHAHTHEYTLAVRDETHFGFMAMAITFICLVLAVKNIAQYEKKVILAFVWFQPA